jgi:hypothetical protein
MPDAELVSYQGNEPQAFRQQVTTLLGLDPADDDRWGVGAAVKK